MPATTTIEQLSDIVECLHTSMQRIVGPPTTYLSAGSAVSFIDTVLRHNPLTMTDLDINAFAPSCRDEMDFQEALERTISAANWQNVPDSFREMRRVVHAQGRDTPLRIVGYRSFARSAQFGAFIDISLFADPQALFQNGYLNTQLVKVPITGSGTLRDSALKIARLGWRDAIAAELAIDVHDGYSSWCRQHHHVVYPAQIALDPVRVGSRLIREYATFNQTIPRNVIEMLQHHSVNAAVDPLDVRVLRNITRLILVAPNGTRYVSYLATTGLLEKLGAVPKDIIKDYLATRQDEPEQISLQNKWKEKVLPLLKGY